MGSTSAAASCGARTSRPLASIYGTRERTAVRLAIIKYSGSQSTRLSLSP